MRDIVNRNAWKKSLVDSTPRRRQLSKRLTSIPLVILCHEDLELCELGAGKSVGVPRFGRFQACLKDDKHLGHLHSHQRHQRDQSTCQTLWVPIQCEGVRSTCHAITPSPIKASCSNVRSGPLAAVRALLRVSHKYIFFNCQASTNSGEEASDIGKRRTSD